MISESLYQLFQPLDTLKGIGPKLKSRLKYLVGSYVIDLIWHLPNGFVDRSYRPNINDAEVGRVASIQCKVIKHTPSFRRNIPYRVMCEDNTGKINLVWFNSRKDYLEKLLPRTTGRAPPARPIADLGGQLDTVPRYSTKYVYLCNTLSG